MPSSSRFPSPVRAAAVETLERRQLFATIPLGEIGLGHRAEYATPHGANSYTFSLDNPATLDIALSNGTASIKRNGVVMSSGEKFSRPLASGNYSIEVNAKGGSSLLVKTSNFSPPTRLEADVWGGNSIRLNWDDNTDAEAYYRIDRWTRLGWRRGQYVPADYTAAVMNNLVPGYATTYRVSAVALDGESLRSANAVTAVTESQPTTGWYKVGIGTRMQKGEAGWVPENRSERGEADTLKIIPQHKLDDSNDQSDWLYADSWQDAVRKAIGSYNMVNGEYSNDSVKVRVTFDGGGKVKDDTVYHNFPSGGDFKVLTAGELRNAGGTGIPSPLGNDTKLIALEDSYGGIDRDYDDFIWTLGVDHFDFAISKTISDQFANESVNYLKDGTGYEGPDHLHGVTLQRKPYLFMGRRADNRVYLRTELAISDQNAEIGMPESLLFGLFIDWPNQTSADPVLTTGTPSTTNPRLVRFDCEPLSGFEKPLFVCWGFDANDNEVLEIGEIKWKDTQEIRVVNQHNYDVARSYLQAGSLVGGPWYGFNHAIKFLDAFLDDAPIEGASQVNNSNIHPNTYKYTHHVGGVFAGGKAPIRHHVFHATSDFSVAVAQTPAILGLIYKTIDQYKTDIVHWFRDHTTESTHQFVLPVTDAEIEFKASDNADINAAIGDGVIGPDTAVVVTFDRVVNNSTEFEITIHNNLANISGSITDLYDFDYDAPSPATEAAIVQAGYGTLGDAGHVFTHSTYIDYNRTAGRYWQYKKATGEIIG